MTVEGGAHREAAEAVRVWRDRALRLLNERVARGASTRDEEDCARNLDEAMTWAAAEEIGNPLEAETAQ